VVKNLQNILRKAIENTSDFKGLVEIYSELPYSRDSLSVQYFNSDALALIKNAKSGDILGPVGTPQGYTIYKYFGTVKSDQEFVRASHILINQFGSDDKNLEEANKIYKRLLEGESFEKLAEQYSADPGSAKNGGDLNYFSKGMMVKEFEDACFGGKINEIQKPIKSTYGYHIIKVTDKTNEKYVVERIINQVKQSATTRDRIFNQASDFSYLAQKNGFESEAKLLNYQVKETPLFSAQSVSVPAIGPNKRLVNYSFDNSVGTISAPFKVPMGYVVVKIAEATEERFTPFEEVKDAIKPAVIREKKFETLEKIARDVYKKLNGNLNNIGSIRPDLQVMNTGSFTPNGNIPNLGRDYLFINNALNAEINKLSQPFKGMRGWYIINVISRTTFNNEDFAAQSSILKDQILNEKKGRFFNELLIRLKDDADIVDNRHFFFGW
jgi:parvulin-like peptidyl-prolyl isomerase